MLLALLEKTSSTKSAGGSSYIFLVLIVAFVALYFLVLRPRSRRARAQSGGNATLSAGDEIITAGGILGTVTAVVGDEIVVEVSPGTTMTFWRRAVNLRTAVPGAPKPSSGSPASYTTVETSATVAPYQADDGSYDDDESYDDESYDDDESFDADPAGGEEPGEEHAGGGEPGPQADGAAADHEVSEADHRDSSGGPGEGR